MLTINSTTYYHKAHTYTQRKMMLSTRTERWTFFRQTVFRLTTLPTYSQMTPPEGEEPIYYVVSYRRQEKKSSDDSLSLALVNLTD